MTHTPGPWHVEPEGCETSDGLPVICKANGHLVAMLADRNLDNASLIAESPELLAVCKELKHLVQFMWQPKHGNIDALLARAHAAIAAAEGK